MRIMHQTGAYEPRCVTGAGLPVYSSQCEDTDGACRHRFRRLPVEPVIALVRFLPARRGMSARTTPVPSPETARLIIDHLATAVLLLDGSLRVRAVNSAAESLLATSASRLQGLDVARVFMSADYWISVLRWALETRRPFFEREVELLRPGPEEVAVDCTVTPLNEPDDGLLVELRQVDSHRRISRDEVMLSQFETAQAMVRGLAHEIRNPLGGLRGAAQLLERELQEPALREYTGVIIGEADRLQKLLDRLLGPRTVPHKQNINVHEIADRVCRLLKAECTEGVSFNCDYDPSIPEIKADPDLLIQAMLNIARNAVQAVGREGQISLRTRVHRQVNIGGHLHRLVVRMDIIDNGPGIEPDMLEKVFYPMVSGRPGGSGVGLSIAQSLIQQHGGVIQCTSRSGETVMSILLPLENGE